LLTDRQTDKQTDRQTNEHRKKHLPPPLSQVTIEYIAVMVEYIKLKSYYLHFENSVKSMFLWYV